MPQGDVVFVAMLDVSRIVLVGGFCVVVSLASLGFDLRAARAGNVMR